MFVIKITINMEVIFFMGRKKIYTEELAEEIVTLRENGLSLNLCADYVQISRTTLYNWLKKGKSKRSSYHGFYLRMKAANANILCIISWR